MIDDALDNQPYTLDLYNICLVGPVTTFLTVFQVL